MRSADIAASEEEAWYLDGSGVPVGWNEGAVALRGVPFPLAPGSAGDVAIGAILTAVNEWSILAWTSADLRAIEDGDGLL